MITHAGASLTHLEALLVCWLACFFAQGTCDFDEEQMVLTYESIIPTLSRVRLRLRLMINAWHSTNVSAGRIHSFIRKAIQNGLFPTRLQSVRAKN